MTTFSEQFPIVFQALNVGFLQTLKLFAITLIGAIPLGLIIAFGSMSNWAAFGFLRPAVLKHVNLRELTWWQKVQVWFVTDFKPVRLLTRLVIWVVRGTPLMLQLLVIYYFPGLVWKNNIWGSGETGRFVASSVAFVFNYACYFSEIYRGGIQGVPKGQSLSRIIALQEVIWAGQAFMKGSQGISGAIWPLFFTGVYYLIFSGILTLLLGWAERKLDYFKA